MKELGGGRETILRQGCVWVHQRKYVPLEKLEDTRLAISLLLVNLHKSLAKCMCLILFPVLVPKSDSLLLSFSLWAQVAEISGGWIEKVHVVLGKSRYGVAC